MRGHFRYNLPLFGDWWQHNQSKQDELQEYEIDINLKSVAKMASHAIFQYNVLAIDDTRNTWTNVFA